MKLTFCLRNAKATSETPIHCYIHFEPYQVKIATGFKIKPKLWNQQKRRAVRGATGEAALNSALAKMESDIAGIFAKLEATGVTPTPEIIKEKYAVVSGRAAAKAVTPAPAPVDIYKAYDDYIARSGFRPGTKANHKKSKNHLKKFATSQRIKMTFERLDSVTWEKFGKWLMGTQKLTTDSAWNTMKSVRAFLADAVERGLTTTTDFRKITRKSLP